jgi:hypothetical protein
MFAHETESFSAADPANQNLSRRNVVFNNRYSDAHGSFNLATDPAKVVSPFFATNERKTTEFGKTGERNLAVK